MTSPLERKAQEIPFEELANAAEEVLKANIPINSEDLARETARVFGIKRLGAKVADTMNEAIAVLVQSGRASRSGSTVRLQ